MFKFKAVFLHRFSNGPILKYHNFFLLPLIIGVIFLFMPSKVTAKTENTGPEVKVFGFSAELKETIKDTRDKFATFEEGLQPIVEELTKLNEEYASLQCNDSLDKGCRDLEFKIKGKYREFLNSLKSRVEPLERSTRKSMLKMHEHFKNISARTYPSDISSEMNKKNKKISPQGPMSARLNKVLQLIGSPKVSLIELAGNTSLDLRMSLDQLASIEMSIESQSDALEMGASFGEIQNWMLETTSSVRSVLGLDAQNWIPSIDLTQSTESDYLL